VLIAVTIAALSFGYGAGWPDVSRLGLTEAVVYDGSLRIDRYADQTSDRADFGGHSYSDKAPGNSFLAVPPLEVLRAAGVIGERERVEGVWHDRGLLWLLRVLTGGAGFVAVLLLVRIAAERLRAGSGTLAAATVGAATMALPLAATTFSHLAAGALVFAAFLLVWRNAGTALAAAAGACAGAAVLFEYTAAVAAACVLGYLLVRRRQVQTALAYVAGSLPLAGILATYNTLAFGSPRHFSYRYEVGLPELDQGLFGIQTPSADGLRDVLVGHRGLFVLSPVLLAASVGLALLWRRGQRGEAVLAATVVTMMTLLAAGFFDPYGGLSPGPRYMASALPFFALGLVDAYERWPRATAALALLSSAGMLYEAGTWGPNVDWSTVWWWAGVPRPLGFAVALAAIAAAVALVAPDVAALTRRKRGTFGETQVEVSMQ
jgi:hypothetical protein